MAGNPRWIKGVSGNPTGRRKHSSRTIKGMLELFIKRNIKARKLQQMYDKLPARDQLFFIAEILPYVTPRQTQMTMKAQLTTLSDNEIDELYKRITGATEDTSFDEILQLPEPIKQPA